MDLTFEDSKQSDSVPNHLYKPTLKEEGVLLTEDKIEEHNDQVNTCYCDVDETKSSRSKKHYLDTGIGSKRHCCCHSTAREIIDKTNVAGENSTGQPMLISQDFHSRKKYERYECVRKSKCIHICLPISVVVNIGLTVAVVLLATKIGKNIKIEGENCPLLKLPKEFLKDSLCIPCDYLGSTVKAEDTLFDLISPCGYKFCCLKNGTLQKFFLLMLQEGYTSKATTDRLASENYPDLNKTLSTWRSRNIAAHLYANVTSLPEKLTWQTNAGFGSAFTQEITLTPESRLQVPRAGFYFIYSAVTFKCQLVSAPIVHLINRQHRGRPNAGVQQLLLSKTSECGPDGIYTSFLAGVLKLTSNDELSVNLTDFSLTSVYKATLSNYFGVYLI